jgi:hypothetical protein
MGYLKPYSKIQGFKSGYSDVKNVSDAFTPLSISGLTLWLDASDTGTITESSNSVSQWDDKSGNTNHATQGTGAAQPITNTRTQNSLNTIDFNGSTHYMDANGAVGVMSGDDTPFTMFVAMEPDDYAPTATAYAFVAGGNSGDNVPELPSYYYNGSTTSGRRNATDNSYKSFTSTANFQVITYEFPGTTLTAYTDTTKELDAVAHNTTGAVTLNRLTIGAQGRTTNFNFYDGKIGEILIYDSALSDANIAAVQAYLISKWGI